MGTKAERLEQSPELLVKRPGVAKRGLDAYLKRGRVRRDGLIARITNFLEPRCSDPRLGFEGGRNVCQDIQFAVFSPGDSGRDAVIEFATGMPLYRSAAYLFPQGDVVQGVVETRARDRCMRHD
jgi:hypothetical protein